MSSTKLPSTFIPTRIRRTPRSPRLAPQAVRLGPKYLLEVLRTGAPLAAGDVTTVLASILLFTTVGNVLGAGLAMPSVGLLGICGVGILFVFSILGLYPGIAMNPVVELRQVCTAVSAVHALLLGGLVVAGSVPLPHFLALAASWPAALVATPLMRSAVRSVCSRFEWWGQRVLVFGGGEHGATVYRTLLKRQRDGLRPVGIVDSIDSRWLDDVTDPAWYLGTTEDASSIAERLGVYWAVIPLPDQGPERALALIDRDARSFPHILLTSPEMAGFPCLWNRSRQCFEIPGTYMQERLLLPIPRLMKWFMDKLLAGIVSLMVLPVVVASVVAIRLTSPGPVMFGHERIGRGGRRFRAWKFRTMVVDADRLLEEHLTANPEARQEWQREHKLKNDPRVTRIGRILRKTSLDELPQIWNVLIGDMSLVGPRPIVSEEIEKYADQFHLFTRVQPGITGLWQVSGRNNTTYERRVELDSQYVRNWSPWLDLYILARTVKVVLLQEGAY